MKDCIFCKIVRGEIPSQEVYSDEKVYAFKDINPQAPTHILIIPKEHISSAAEINAENSGSIAHIFEVISELTARMGLSSYRIVTNQGEEAGQTVFHLHFHILSGRRMNEMC